MRILVDLQACQNASATRGIGRVAMELTRAMIAAGRGHEWRVLLSDAFPDTILPLRRALADVLPQDHILVCALPGRSASADPGNAWRTRAAELLLADFVAQQAPDLFLVPSLFEGFWDDVVTSVERDGCPTAVLLYDFIPLDNADVYLPGPGIRAAYLRKMRAAMQADVRLAISRHVADDAALRLGLPAGRVTAMPLGVDPAFRPPLPEADTAALAARHGITRPFVLNTSGFEPRKNLERLVAAFALLPAPLRQAHQLVIVGKMTAAARRTLGDAAAAAGLPGDALVLPGFVPDDDLVALYGGCALFAFPSLGEGFGLPVLEAMACGAPVVGSATTSIPEVIGRHDLLFDPTDPAAIAAAMARVLGDPALAAELRGYGIARSKAFGWSQAAAIALDAFEQHPPRVRQRPEAPPPPARPSLALVTAALPVAEVEALAWSLDPAFAVTPVLPEGMLADPLAAACFEARNVPWFERHAPDFDHILYVAADSGGLLPGLMEAFPGALLRLHPREGNAADGQARDRLAGGIAGLASGDAPRAGAAMALHATITIEADEAGEAHLPAAILSDTAHRHAPRAIFAAKLPPMVRDVRPSDEDLAGVARAFARNEAHRRAPMVLIDLSGLPDDALDPSRRALLVALFAAAGREARGVRLTAAGWSVADRRVAQMLGLSPDPFADRSLPLRPGDRLLSIDLLGDGADDHRAAIMAGTIVARVTIDAPTARSTHLGETVIRWLLGLQPTMRGSSACLHLASGRVDAVAHPAGGNEDDAAVIHRCTMVD